jgi:type III secretion protein J
MMRIARFLLAPLAVASLLTACGGYVELMAAIPEQEANEVLAALLDANIKAEKAPGKEGMVSLRVDKSQVARAVDTLRARGLPRERFARMGEVFRKEGLISSPLEERARYLWALSQELAGTISQIDGVITARVHIVLPERGSAGDPSIPSSASVFIKHQTLFNLEPVLPQVRRLITTAIPGLAGDKVSVVLVPSMLTAPGPSAGAEVVSVMGVRLERDSTGVLWALVAFLGALLAAIAAGGYAGWRYYSARRSAGAPAPGAAPGR